MNMVTSLEERGLWYLLDIFGDFDGGSNDSNEELLPSIVVCFEIQAKT